MDESRPLLISHLFASSLGLAWLILVYVTPPPPPSISLLRPEEAATPNTPAGLTANETPLQALTLLIAEQAELSPSTIHAESHLLRDLHLNSIKVAEIVALACRRLGLPLPLVS